MTSRLDALEGKHKDDARKKDDAKKAKKRDDDDDDEVPPEDKDKAKEVVADSDGGNRPRSPMSRSVLRSAMRHGASARTRPWPASGYMTTEFVCFAQCNGTAKLTRKVRSRPSATPKYLMG